MPTVKTAKKETQSTTSGLNIPVYGIDGSEKKTMELPKEMFKAEVNQPLIAQSVRVYLANQRSGTASTKTRSEVVGSTRKIYRQKGTGRARHGNIRAPIFVGGGVVGGPKPKDHSLKMGRDMRKKALFSALSLRQKNKEIIGLSEAGLEKVAKTKEAHSFLKKLDLAGKKVVFIFSKLEGASFLKAIRNIPGVKVTDAMSLNPYMALNGRKLIFTESAVSAMKDHFIGKKVSK